MNVKKLTEIGIKKIVKNDENSLEKLQIQIHQVTMGVIQRQPNFC